MQPRLPRTGGPPDEIRSHVLDHQRGDQLRPLGGQTPGMQTAHRMSDECDRYPQAAYRVTEIGDEAFGADRVRIVDVTPSVPRSVVGVHRAQSGKPRQLTWP